MLKQKATRFAQIFHNLPSLKTEPRCSQKERYQSPRIDFCVIPPYPAMQQQPSRIHSGSRGSHLLHPGAASRGTGHWISGQRSRPPEAARLPDWAPFCQMRLQSPDLNPSDASQCPKTTALTSWDATRCRWTCPSRIPMVMFVSRNWKTWSHASQYVAR
jgi:hypothetical protein